MQPLLSVAVALFVLVTPLVARDYTTPLTVKAATEDEIAIVLKLLKEHVEADTDDKRIVVLHDAFSKLAVDSLTKKGQPLPELNAESVPVIKLRDEQPKLQKMYQSLQSKDGKCRVWRIISYLEKSYSDPEKPPRLQDASKQHPELIIQFTEGETTYQKSFRRNSKNEWFTSVITTSAQNPITEAP